MYWCNDDDADFQCRRVRISSLLEIDLPRMLDECDGLVLERSRSQGRFGFVLVVTSQVPLLQEISVIRKRPIKWMFVCNSWRSFLDVCCKVRVSNVKCVIGRLFAFTQHTNSNE